MRRVLPNRDSHLCRSLCFRRRIRRSPSYFNDRPSNHWKPEWRLPRRFGIDPSGNPDVTSVVTSFLDGMSTRATVQPSLLGTDTAQPSLLGLGGPEGAPISLVGAPEEDDRAEEMLDPFAELRTTEFFSLQRQLALISPESPFASSLSAPGWVPSEQDVNQIIDAYNDAVDSVAATIAAGHASGYATNYEFESQINQTIRSPSESGALSNGRSWYYNQPNNFFVLVNPGTQDGGSAYNISGSWPRYRATLR